MDFEEARSGNFRWNWKKNQAIRDYPDASFNSTNYATPA